MKSSHELKLTFEQPLCNMIDACQSACVSECCGIDAFEFDHKNTNPFFKKDPLHTILLVLDQIEDLVYLVANHDGEISSDRLNQSWQTPAECLEFLGMLQSEVLDVARSRRRESLLVDPHWLQANGSAVRNIAQAIQQDWTFDSLPILADALEEAGCEDVNLLSHCRQPREHGPSCWVVELLLSEEA